MPVLTIGDGKGGTDEYDPFVVVAAMVFPRDVEKQRQFVGRAIEHAIGTTEGRASAGQIPKLAGLSRDVLGSTFGAMLGQRLVPLGGLSALSAAPSFDSFTKEIADCRWAGSVAGDMLHWIVALHLHGFPASVRRAITIAEVYYKDVTTLAGRNLGASTRYIQHNWEHFKPAAHLWAALRMWDFAGESPPTGPDWFSPFFVESLPTFLTYAQWYVRTAASIIPQGRKEPILAAAAAWQAPSDYPRNSSARMRSQQLPDWILDLAGKPKK